MPMFLKVVSENRSPVPTDNPHTVYSDIVSCNFTRNGDGEATAFCYVRDNVKTAMVNGFSEHERLIGFTGEAYLMNEQGRTISSFTSRSSGDLVAAQ